MSGLCLTQIGLRHFRSHRRLDLGFDGRPVAIHGGNGAGKTNLLEAISMLSPGRGLRRAAGEDLIRRPEALGWKVTAEIDGHSIETMAEPDVSRQVRIDGKLSPQIALGRVARILWLVPAMDRLWIEGADGRRRFLDRAVLSLDPNHSEAVLTYEKAMRERNRLLKDMVRDAHWYVALEKTMADSGTRITAGRQTTIAALMAAQANADTAFPAAELTLESPDGLAAADEASLRDALAASRPRDLAAGRSLVGPHRSDLGAVWAEKSVSAKDCSTGEQKALLISLILANSRALAARDGRAPILLLDEVAAHLDSGRRAALYDEICTLGAQAFMTGTGAELFDDLGARAQYLEISETQGQSQVHNGL